MSEALHSVRGSLGPNALILETASLAAEIGGGVEITAAAEAGATSAPDGAEIEVVVPGTSHPMDEIRRELATLKNLLYWLASGMHQANELINRLLEQGTAPEVVAAVAAAMKQAPGANDRERLRHALNALIPSGGQIRGDNDRLALVGPSGVGKSSAIIRLTIFESQRRARRVGWVSTDPRRWTTGDPLAVYAGILGVRYETAGNREELKQSLDGLADCELVLVDTAGANPRDPKSMREVTKLLHGFPDLRRTLLLNAATNGADMAEWTAAYRKTGLHSLMFTKLDECRFFGPALGAATTFGLPLSYLATGPNFTGDIKIAEPESFANLVLSGSAADD